MRKLLSVVLLGAMVVTMGACGTNKENNVNLLGGDSSTWGPELEDTTEDATGTEENSQIANPFVEYDTVEEALQHLDFTVVVPESIDGYTDTYIAVMDDTMFQITYQNSDSEICIRKQAGDGDISGDYNAYSTNETIDADGIQVSISGNNDTVSKAIWTKDGYTYSIYTTASLTQGDITDLIAQIQ